MIDILINGIGWTDIALTLNRIAVGTFFMLSGYHKLFNAERHRALADELKALGIHAVGFNQWWVPTIEFAGGAAVVIGLLAPLAALGLLVVTLVAIATTGPQRINLSRPIDRADRIDDWLYVPETLYVFMLVLIVCWRRTVQPRCCNRCRRAVAAGSESCVMRRSGFNDALILTARLLLAALFLIFGWRKLRDYSGTVSQITQLGGPMPPLAAAVAIFMELPVAFAVLVGAFTRSSALLMFFYTLGTALIGHRYWTLTDAAQVDSMDGFYKNLSIMGGLLLLFVTGAGHYSIDALRGVAAP